MRIDHIDYQRVADEVARAAASGKPVELEPALLDNLLTHFHEVADERDGLKQKLGIPALRAETSEIYDAMLRERVYEVLKWGYNPHEIPGWIAIMRKFLGKAEDAWLNGSNRDALAEILQVMTVGMSCLMEHGLSERFTPLDGNPSDVLPPLDSSQEGESNWVLAEVDVGNFDSDVMPLYYDHNMRAWHDQTGETYLVQFPFVLRWWQLPPNVAKR